MSIAVVASVFSFSADAQPLHRAIALWLEEKPEEAMREVETHIAPPARSPGRADAQNAALRNLGARILFARYERLRGYTGNVGDAFLALKAARAYASAAVWESPHEIEYWRDFIRLNAFDEKTQKPDIAAFMGTLNTGTYTFEVEGAVRKLTDHGELKQIASAISAEQRGDIVLAEQRLESWVESNRQRCASSVVLADVQMEMDHYASAQALLEDRAERCGENVKEACALKVGRIQLLTPSRRSQWSGVARVSNDEDDDREINEDLDVTSFADVDENFFDIADRLLRDPARIDDWHRLWEVAGTDRGLQKRFDQLLAIVRGRPGASRVPEITRAYAYRRIALGDFKRARKELEALVLDSAGNADAEAVVGTLLLDADSEFDAPSDADKRLSDAKRADPYLTSCVNEKELKKCHLRRHGCAPPLVLCNDPVEFIYRVYAVGVAERPHAVRGTNQFVRSQTRYTAQMIRDTETRMLAEIQSREAGMLRRIAAVEDRVDIIVEVKLAAMERDIRKVTRNQADFERRMQTEYAKWKRDVARNLEATATKAARAEQTALATSQFVSRVWTQYKADLAFLKATARQLPQWTTARDEQKVEASVLKLASAMREMESSVHELKRPALARNLDVLFNWPNESNDKRFEALWGVLNEADTVAMALFLPNKWKLLALGPAVKSVSDVAIDVYRRWKQRKEDAKRQKNLAMPR